MVGPGSLDVPAFETLVERHRAEIRAHCYRILGSIDDAEDAVQEAQLAAWRGRATFAGRASPRTWLFRIATNVCLRQIERRAAARRVLPPAIAPSTPFRPLGEPQREVAWLDPIPDSWLPEIRDEAPGPEARIELRESVRLAFVVALQVLPARQRAVLLLRDVVGLTASETAQCLDVSIAASNSALQRARATLRARLPDTTQPGRRLADREEALLGEYVRRWEAADVEGFVALLARDATWTMPPWAEWFVGPEAIGAFLAWAFRARRSHRLIRTSANGGPAFGYYRSTAADPDRLEPFAIHLVEIDTLLVRSITNFVESGRFAAFGLPDALARDGR
jgi:RNA polymerase sigma-70 factor, ECF subfamily